MRALSAGGNYSDYANSGFCSTPLPGGGLLPSPPPYPSPPCRCCCLRHLSCLIFIIQGRPSSFKLFSEPLEPAPPRRHLPPPPIEDHPLELATTLLLHRCLSINLFIFRRGKFREGTRSTQKDRERKREIRSVGTKGRKKGRKGVQRRV